LVSEKCSRCGVAWPWTHAYVLAGQAQAGRGGAAPPTFERAAELAQLVEVLESSDAGAIYVGWICAETESREAVARYATEKRFGGRTWSENDVRRAIAWGRRVLQHELERRGMLLEGG